jgi:hypothetical protein
MRFARIDIGGERHAVAVVTDDGALLVRLLSLCPQSMPSFSRASGAIICRFQGGSHTGLTLASEIPAIVINLLLASNAIEAPMPQPGAVSVILTSTLLVPSVCGVTSMP